MSFVPQFLPILQIIGPLALEAAIAVLIIWLLERAVNQGLWRRALWQVCMAGLFILWAAETTGVLRPALQHFRQNSSMAQRPAAVTRRLEPGSPSLAAPKFTLRSEDLRFDERLVEGGQAKELLNDEVTPPPTLKQKSDIQAEFFWVGLIWFAGSALCLIWLMLTQAALLILYRKRAVIAVSMQSELGSTRALACPDRRLAGRNGSAVQNGESFERTGVVGEGADHRTRGRVRSPSQLNSGFDAEFEELLASLMRRLQIQRRVRVIECERLKTPVAFGLLRPTIGLPKGFTSIFNSREQEAVLAHELAHLALCDPAWQFFGKSVVALLWWHPLVWWAHRQWHLASECAADEASVLATGGPDALAECLLRFGERLTAVPALGRLGIRGDGFRSSLGRRVARLFEIRAKPLDEPMRPPRVLFQLSGLAALTATLVCGGAWATPKIFGTEKINQGETVMTTIQQSWQRSLFAVTLAAAVGSRSERALPDETPQKEPSPATQINHESTEQPAQSPAGGIL